MHILAFSYLCHIYDKVYELPIVIVSIYIFISITFITAYLDPDL